LEKIAEPPFDTIVEIALPPFDTNNAPPLRTLVTLALPTEFTDCTPRTGRRLLVRAAASDNVNPTGENDVASAGLARRDG